MSEREAFCGVGRLETEISRVLSVRMHFPNSENGGTHCGISNGVECDRRFRRSVVAPWAEADRQSGGGEAEPERQVAVSESVRTAKVRAVALAGVDRPIPVE